jgi:hypothetical protein
MMIRQLMLFGQSSSVVLICVVVPDWDILVLYFIIIIIIIIIIIYIKLSKDNRDKVGSEKWNEGIVKKFWDGSLKESDCAPTSASGSKTDLGEKEKEKKSSGLCSSEPKSITSSTGGAADAEGRQPGGELLTPLYLRLALENNESIRSLVLSDIRKACEAVPDKIRRYEIPKGIVSL